MCMHTPPATFPCATFLLVAEVEDNCETSQLADSYLPLLASGTDFSDMKEITDL